MAVTYTPTTNFSAKDSLPSNDPSKVIKGSEFSVEFTAIQTAFSLAAPVASPTFTGTVTIPTADINGGNIDGTVIGGASAAAGTFTTLNATGGGALTGTWSDLGTVTTVDINGGTIDGAALGSSSTITALTVSGNVSVDGGTIKGAITCCNDDGVGRQLIGADAPVENELEQAVHGGFACIG